MKQLFRTLTLCVLPLLIAACSTDYNFDKVSLEVTVGDAEGISVPLGTTGKITVGDLLKDAELGTGEDGFYGFSYRPEEGPLTFNVEVGALDPITGLTPAIDPIEESLFEGFHTSIANFYGKKDLDIPGGLSGGMTLTQPLIDMLGVEQLPMQYEPHTFEESFSIELPAQVASLEEVTFGTDGNGSILDVQFDLGGLAGVTKNCKINSLYFELPAGFVINKVPSDPLYDYIDIKPGTGSETNNHFEIKNYTFTGSHIVFDIILEKVVLDHLTLDENNMVTITEDVTFALDATVEIQPGEISVVSPYVEMNVTPTVSDATIIVNEITHSFEFEEQIEKSIAVPDLVKRIDRLTICNANDNTLSPEFNVEIALAGAPVDALELRDVEITLPTFLDIETPQGWNYNDGKLTPADKLIVSNNNDNHIINLKINGIKSLDIVDGNLSLDSAIGLNATVAIAANTPLHISNSPQNISIVPTVTLDDIAIKEVEGLIDPDLSQMMPKQEIPLGDFTSALKGLEMDLNIESPLLSVTVDNPIGVGIDATILLTPYKGEEAGEVVSADIQILPAATTNILLAGDASRAEGVTVVEGLTDLITALPDKIVVEFEAETNKDSSHILELKDEYTFTVDYAVEAAFKFDTEKDGSIDYTVMLEDVDLSALADIDILVENITVKVASESTLPIDLTMDVELLDENDAPIECVTSSTKGAIAGSTSAEPKLSECDVVLNIETPSAESSKPTPFAQIARTKKVRCTLHGTTLAGGGLRPEQYISAKLSLLLEEGITIDLGTLLPEEEKPEPNQPEQPEPNESENPAE
ncbi:MAG: hypothetical protein IJZ09_04550 [Tidjanibacter sp.]|nr:hypothetical protein [Tidjanibacter sp.]